MQVDSEYLKELLRIAIEHPEATCGIDEFFAEQAVNTEDESSIDRLFYHLTLLGDHGFVELPPSRSENTVLGITRDSRDGYYYVNGPRLRVTAQGQDFYAQVTNSTIWEKVKPAMSSFGIPVAVELAKVTALKAVGL